MNIIIFSKNQWVLSENAAKNHEDIWTFKNCGFFDINVYMMVNGLKMK